MKKKRERETKEKLPGWINVASTIRIAPLPSTERTKHVHVKLDARPGKDYFLAACQLYLLTLTYLDMDSTIHLKHVWRTQPATAVME